MCLIRRRPLVLYSLCFIAGFVCAYWSQPEWLTWHLSVAAAIACCGLLLWRPRHADVAAGLLILLAAAGIYAAYDQGNHTLIDSSMEETELLLRGRIVSPVTVDGDRAAFRVKLLPGEQAEGEVLQISVRILRQEEQQLAKGWQRGDKAELHGTLKKPAEARNFGAFDYRRYLRYQHVHWTLALKGTEEQKVTSPPAGEVGAWLPLRWNDALRALLANRIAGLFPAEQAGFMKSMLIGYTDDMDPRQFERFSKLGLTHILAISGLNVGIFLACLLWGMRRLRFTKETYLWTAILLLPCYVLVTGASPSIVRAGLMAMIALYAAYRNRWKDGLHITLLSAVIMLVWEPYYLVDVSFQLSYLVTIGLILGVPVMNKLLPMRASPWKDAISITVVAQLISFPVSIYYFSQFSLLSLAANLLLVPVFSLVIMPGGSAALLLGIASPQIGKGVAWLITRGNDWIFLLVEWIAKWDQFQTLWPQPSLLWIVLYYSILTLLSYALLRGRTEQSAPQPMLELPPKRGSLLHVKHRWGTAAACIAFAAHLAYGYISHWWSPFGAVQFLDVGQGDSILIQTPGKRVNLLVDGGGTLDFAKAGEEWKRRSDPYEVGRKLLVPLLKQRGVQQLDYVIMTHEDLDHMGGLQAVLEHIPVRYLLFNGTLKPTEPVKKLFATVLEKGTLLLPAKAGDRLKPGDDTLLHVLYPHSQADMEGGSIRIEKEQNDSSIVFLMELEGLRFLFTGDIEAAGERAMLSLLPDSLFKEPVDVLKVAHHGSKTSTTEEWVRKWRAKHAVISAGVNNVYGHPNPQVLERLQSSGSAIFRTDRDGEVQMRVRDGRLEVRTKRGVLDGNP